MTDTTQAYRAGIDAVIADGTLNKGGFADAIRTVLTARFSNADAIAWIDAIAVEYNRLGLINNPTYNNLRNSINDADISEALFDSLASVAQLPEGQPASASALLIDLRETRDNIDAAIDRLQAIIDAEPGGAVGRLVKEIQRNGKDLLRNEKQQVRTQIQSITGDPDN